MSQLWRNYRHAGLCTCSGLNQAYKDDVITQSSDFYSDTGLYVNSEQSKKQVSSVCQVFLLWIKHTSYTTWPVACQLIQAKHKACKQSGIHSTATVAVEQHMWCISVRLEDCKYFTSALLWYKWLWGRSLLEKHKVRFRLNLQVIC